MVQTAPVTMCPMAATCKGMMGKPLSGLMMAIPGIALIAVGVLIVVWPSVLPGLAAAACILVGAAMLLVANFMRRIGARPGRAGD